MARPPGAADALDGEADANAGGDAPGGGRGRLARLRIRITAETLGIGVAAVACVSGMHLVRRQSTGLGLGAAMAGIAPFALLCLLVSRLLPHDRSAPWTALLPGALLVGASVWAVHLASPYDLVHRVQNASELYGSLGVAAAILAWLYLMARVIVASAMLNATLWDRRRQPDG